MKQRIVRLIPIEIRKRIFAFRQQRRRAAAISQAAARARAVIREISNLKTLHPDRQFYGILLVEHLGDIIACEPVIGWARKASPHAFVVWIVKDSYAELLSSHPGLDAVITVGSLASAASIIESNVFDVVIDLHINNKPTGIEDVVHTKSRGDPSVDSVTYFRERSLLRAFSKAAGIPQFRAPPTMYLDPATANSVDALRLPPRFVVIHTTSNDAARDWSAQEWEKLIAYVADECDLTVVEVGLRPTVSADHPRITSLCGQLTLNETAEVIRRSAFFIGVDSGPAHMANAWRKPSLLLFGRFAGEDDWCPYEGFFAEQAGERIYRHPGRLADLPAALVIGRLKRDGSWRSIVSG